MTRLILLTLLNLALPFLVRAVWLMSLQMLYQYRRRQQGAEVIDVTPPRWHFPVRKLLVAGLVLLALSLFVLRFVGESKDSWQPANPAVSKNY
jgi:hypothetical protein